MMADEHPENLVVLALEHADRKVVAADSKNPTHRSKARGPDWNRSTPKTGLTRCTVKDAVSPQVCAEQDGRLRRDRDARDAARMGIQKLVVMRTGIKFEYLTIVDDTNNFREVAPDTHASQVLHSRVEDRKTARIWE
jgi:hypothetical protein